MKVKYQNIYEDSLKSLVLTLAASPSHRRVIAEAAETVWTSAQSDEPTQEQVDDMVEIARNTIVNIIIGSVVYDCNDIVKGQMAVLANDVNGYYGKTATLRLLVALGLLPGLTEAETKEADRLEAEAEAEAKAAA